MSGLVSTHGLNATPKLLSARILDALSVPSAALVKSDATALTSRPTSEVSAPVSRDEEDTIMQTVAKVASIKGLHVGEQAGLLYVLRVGKWRLYPGIDIVGMSAEEQAQNRADWEKLMAALEVGEEYGRTHQWYLHKPEMDRTQESKRGMALVNLWARGFVTGKFTEGFTKSMQLIVKLTIPDLAKLGTNPPPIEKFLETYGSMTDEGGTSSGAIAVILLALGALMYLTRR